MNKTVLVTTVLLASVTVAVAADQPSASPNIAVVNLEQVFEGYQMTRDLEARFDSVRRQLTEEAGNRRQAVESKLAALEAFDPSSKEFADRKAEVQRMQIEARLWVELEEQKLKDEHMAWLRRIYEDVRTAVAAEAEKRNIDLVLTYKELPPNVPDSMTLRQEILLKQVLYFNDRVDLTESVLTSLNEKYTNAGGAATLRVGAGPTAAPVPAEIEQAPTTAP